MEQRSNYDITRDKMEERFTQYNQEEMIQKFQLRHTANHLFITFIGELYRVDRFSGKVERCPDGESVYTHAGFNESMTIFDVLCCSKPDCRLSGEYVTVTNLPGIAKTSAPGTGMYPDISRIFTNRGDMLRQACERLHGTARQVGDVSYCIPLFDFMPIMLQFWDADDEFDASLKIMWDKNVLDFMHYETTFYALGHFFKRLTESL